MKKEDVVKEIVRMLGYNQEMLKLIPGLEMAKDESGATHYTLKDKDGRQVFVFEKITDGRKELKFMAPGEDGVLQRAVLVDGKESGVITDGELVFKKPLPEQITLTFRKPGLREATRVVKLPLAPGESVGVSLEGASATFSVNAAPYSVRSLASVCVRSAVRSR